MAPARRGDVAVYPGVRRLIPWLPFWFSSAAWASADSTAGGGAQQWQVLSDLPKQELRDVDCDRVRGSLVEWPEVRNTIHRLDMFWQGPDKTSEVCKELQGEAGFPSAHIVLARPVDAASECVLGALSAVLAHMVCFSECGTSPPGQENVIEAFDFLWKAALAGTPDQTVPAYMLGTTSWPVASLLSKWQMHCGIVSPRPPVVGGDGSAQPCTLPEVGSFTALTQAAAEEHLMPLLWGTATGASPDRMLGVFAQLTISSLANFANSAAVAAPSFSEDRHMVMFCE